MLKIAITGPESTGKTTLSRQLAETFAGLWVPEYAREYLEHNGLHYQREDLQSILEGQILRMEFVLKSDSPIVFYDTEVLVLKIWETFKYGSTSGAIESAWNQQAMDLYLLCDIDLPWEDDPMREHPHQRQILFDMYRSALETKNRPFTIIHGMADERLLMAIDSVKKLYHW
jgi:NadR type nicotinamide-nucleotide adenylyltransferase